jgi:hypothetical protein
MQRVMTASAGRSDDSFLYRNIITSPGGPMKFWIVVAHLGDFQVATGDHFRNVTVVIEEFESK